MAPVLKLCPAETDLILSRSDAERWRALAFCSTERARALLDYKTAVRLCTLPLAVYGEHGDGAVVSVAVAEPCSPEIIQELRFAFGCEVSTESAKSFEIEKAIHAAYLGQGSTLALAVKQANTEEEKCLPAVLPPRDLQDADGPIPKLLEAILNRAITLSASDIHIEPYAGNYRVRFRVDGLLREDDKFSVTPLVSARLSRRIKVMAKLDTTCLSKPQEGGFSFEASHWSMRLRVSVIPQIDGEKIVLRLLDNNFLELKTSRDRVFTKLGMGVEHERLILSSLGAQSGVILLCGPTGSGKSTLLYAALQYLNNDWRNIVTLEDPVERLVPGINQTEIDRKQGLDYPELLPALLRQDPDVIMLGEIRDDKTAETVLTAGITGHLVLSTVHAGTCLEVFTRLRHLSVSAELLASSLRLIVSQRLIPRNCRQCMVSEPATEGLRELFHLDSDTQVSCATGCEACAFSGVNGRFAVFECLLLTDEIRGVLLSAPANEMTKRLREVAYHSGYRPLAFDVREALLSTEVSPKAALRTIGIAPEFVGYRDSKY